MPPRFPRLSSTGSRMPFVQWGACSSDPSQTSSPLSPPSGRSSRPSSARSTQVVSSASRRNETKPRLRARCSRRRARCSPGSRPVSGRADDLRSRGRELLRASDLRRRGARHRCVRERAASDPAHDPPAGGLLARREHRGIRVGVRVAAALLRGRDPSRHEVAQAPHPRDVVPRQLEPHLGARHRRAARAQLAHAALVLRSTTDSRTAETRKNTAPNSAYPATPTIISLP